MYQFIGYLGRYIPLFAAAACFQPSRCGREVAHIENYLDMVGLQSPGSVMLMADIQEEAQGCRVLPFSVYTFVGKQRQARPFTGADDVGLPLGPGGGGNPCRHG